MIKPLSLLAALIACSHPSPGFAGDEFLSSERATQLVELFTSEGCSSCPPAEERLAGLKTHPGLWTDFVPVAFHVNYWDRLGWPDRFARPEFTERQHAYASEWRASSVYTPCMVLGGREWRAPLPAAVSGSTRPGRLRLSIAKGAAEVSFDPTSPTDGPFVAEVALLGSDVISRVRSGENAGRELRHGFVALAPVRIPLAGEGTLRGSASLPIDLAAPPSAVAAWVEVAGSPAPLQAVGGWLKGP